MTHNFKRKLVREVLWLDAGETPPAPHWTYVPWTLVRKCKTRAVTYKGKPFLLCWADWNSTSGLKWAGKLDLLNHQAMEFYKDSTPGGHKPRELWENASHPEHSHVIVDGAFLMPVNDMGFYMPVATLKSDEADEMWTYIAETFGDDPFAPILMADQRQVFAMSFDPDRKAGKSRLTIMKLRFG